MPPLIAALDADVLVPIVSCDFLLTAFDLAVFEPIVSAAVLGEVERSLVEDFPNLDPSAVKSRVGHMRIALTDQTIDTAATVTSMPDIINRKDRHVVAAAQTAEADVVVTNDKDLRSDINRAALDLTPLSTDAFGELLWEKMPERVDETIRALVAKRHRQPVTPEIMAKQLQSSFPTLTSSWITWRAS